jgi:hypothetical protein
MTPTQNRFLVIALVLWGSSLMLQAATLLLPPRPHDLCPCGLACQCPKGPSPLCHCPPPCPCAEGD